MRKQSVDILIGLPGAGKDTWAGGRIADAALMNEKCCMISHFDKMLVVSGE